jgi:hypothetical protein
VIFGELRQLPDSGIEAVTWIKFLIEGGKRRFHAIQMSDVVLGRIFGAAMVQQLPHFVFELKAVISFLDDIVLMKHMAKRVALIELD